MHERLVEPQVRCGLQGKHLCGTVDELVGPGAGVTVDVALALHAEVERQVREALLYRGDVPDLFAPAAQRAADVVERIGAYVLDEQRVELADLVEGIELIYRVLGEAAHAHLQIGGVLEEDVLPKLALGLLQKVLVFQDLQVLRSEAPVPVGVPDHGPAVFPAELRRDYALLLPLRLQEVLVWR